jgi:hypothetical protein
MSAFIRSILIAAAFIGTVSAVSAAPHRGDSSYYSRGEYQPGVMDKFNQFARKGA